MFFIHSRRRKALALHLTALLSSFTVAWVAVGQRLDGIPAYLRSSIEIVSGYSGSMGTIELSKLALLPWQIWFAAGGIVLFGAILAAAVARRDRALAYLVALCLPVVFVLFKDAFVRLSGRHMFYYTGLGICAALIMVQASLGLGARRPRVRVVVPGLIVGLVALINLGAPMVALGAMTPPTPRFPWVTLGARLSTYPVAMKLLTSNKARSARARLGYPKAIREYGLPKPVVDRLRSGTVDVVPWEVGMIKAYDLRWKPRGVLQSYSAYTPYLDQLDAHRYATDGPDRVVLRNDFIDDRCPQYDEPEFFRTLLLRYQVESRVGEMLILRRRPGPVGVAQVELGAYRTGFGEWLDVPALGSNPVYGAIEVHPSIIGRLLDFVFQPPEAHLVLRKSNGETQTCRLIPNSVDGLLISDYIGWIGDTEALFQHKPTAYRIEAIKVTTSGPTAYQPEISTRFFSSSSP